MVINSGWARDFRGTKNCNLKLAFAGELAKPENCRCMDLCGNLRTVCRADGGEIGGQTAHELVG